MKKNNLRQQAEAELSQRLSAEQAGNPRTGSPPETEPDVQRLVRELQVHQIELEMQNEELVQARAETEQALRQYTDLYDFSPVGYFTLTRDGTIRQVNLAGANLLGFERRKLVKRRFGVFVSNPSRKTFGAFLEKVFTGKRKEICEVSLGKDGTDLIWVRIEAIFNATDSDRKHEVCWAVVSDITERVQVEQVLRHLNTHDALTGIYNRNFFVAEMDRLEHGRQFPVSIVMADVDSLKNTNDQEGHAAGDAVLKRVAEALTTAFRSEDVVARIGGDEFAVLLPATDTTSAEVLLGRLHQVIQENNTTHTKTPIHLSIGVSTAENPMPLSAVLNKADANMYREKGGSGVS